MIQDRKGCNSTGTSLMRKQHRILKERCQCSIQSRKVCGTERGPVTPYEKVWRCCQAEVGEVTFSDVPAMSITMWGQRAQGNKAQNNLSSLSCVLVTGPDHSWREKRHLGTKEEPLLSPATKALKELHVWIFSFSRLGIRDGSRGLNFNCNLSFPSAILFPGYMLVHKRPAGRLEG